MHTVLILSMDLLNFKALNSHVVPRVVVHQVAGFKLTHQAVLVLSQAVEKYLK